MINETGLRILAAFFPEGTERTTKEIEVRSGYSHERAYSTLAALKKEGMLSMRKVGKALVYSISSFNDATYFAFVYFSLDKKGRLIKKYPIVWKALKELIAEARPELIILFGSYSKDKPKRGSDVDILVIDSGCKTEKVALSLRHKYGLRITPISVKKDDFKNIREENPEFWEDLVKFGIILKGNELFYELTYLA